jgi:uncharacterized membrane protein YjjB (DUF3815 family)
MEFVLVFVLALLSKLKAKKVAFFGFLGCFCCTVQDLSFAHMGLYEWALTGASFKDFAM